MKRLSIFTAIAATPATAHHEVILATTALPALGWLAIVASAGSVALWAKWRGK